MHVSQHQVAVIEDGVKHGFGKVWPSGLHLVGSSLKAVSIYEGSKVYIPLWGLAAISIISFQHIHMVMHVHSSRGCHGSGLLIKP